MISHYLILFLRSFSKRKLFSIINTLGLALSVAFSLLVFLFITNEHSYDQFHENAKNIYRINSAYYDPKLAQEGEANPYTHHYLMPGDLANTLRESAPEVAELSLLREIGKQVIIVQDKPFTQDILLVDSGFFNMFDYPLKSGSLYKLFVNPNDAVITPETAKKLFGNEDPIGQTIQLNFEHIMVKEFTVRAVIESPANSSIRFQMLLPIQAYKFYHEKSWGVRSFPTFVQVHPNASITSFLKRLDTLQSVNQEALVKYFRERYQVASAIPIIKTSLTKLTDVHFDTRVNWPGANSVQYSWILGGVALLITLIASINYISFALTSLASRVREVGIRKSVGATNGQLFLQFNTESLSQAMLAGIAGIVIALTALPLFNSLMQKSITISDTPIITAILFLLTLIIIIAILSGSYPALIISSLRPVRALTGIFVSGSGVLIRSLVVLQFAMSTFLMISAIIMYNQMDYVTNKPLGYSGNAVIALPTYLGWGEESDQAIARFRAATENSTLIEKVSGAVEPLSGGGRNTMDFNGHQVDVYFNTVDAFYLDLFSISISEGKNFEENPILNRDVVIVNEAFVESAGLSNPVGQQYNFDQPGSPGGNRIIGVVKNFHFKSLEEEIRPIVLQANSESGHLITLVVKLDGTRIPEALNFAKNTWAKLYPDKPFDFHFVEDAVGLQYEQYNKWKRITGYATALAIVISSLGLFGLSGINVLRRTKEIAIRKVLGVKTTQLFIMLNLPFIQLAGISFMLSVPVSWYVMHKWLGNFKFHITIGWEVMLVSMLLGIVVTMVAVSYHILQSIRLNPTDTLKCE